MNTTTRSIPTRLTKALYILQDNEISESLKVSKKDAIIFVIGSTGAGKSTFINTAISEDLMVVNDTLASCTSDVQSIKCVSPWNPYGRGVIFAEIPAFNHSDITIRKKIPELISRWLSKTYCAEGPIDSGILYLHSMASPRMNEDFKKHLDPFVKLCHECGHKPISALLVSTLWCNDESEAEVHQRTAELEEYFQKSITSAIHPIPGSVCFDGSQASACKAIDSLMRGIQQNIWKTTDSTIYSAPRLTLSESILNSSPLIMDF